MLNYLPYGHVHLPRTTSKENFLRDLDYYGVHTDRETIEYECYAKKAKVLGTHYHQKMEGLAITQNTHTEQVAAHTQRIEDHLAAEMRHNVRNKDLLESQNDHH